MRTALAVVLFAIAALAQNPSPATAALAACGPTSVNFDVKDDNSQHIVGQPEAGKALVYVIQKIGVVKCIGGCITTKVALDGTWIGANHHNSYLSFDVGPGEHHLFATWQSRLSSASRVVGLAHFTAEPGKVYFFKARMYGVQQPAYFDFDPLDSDMGRFFVASIPASISIPKK
jgi:hypothetical protein